MRHLTEILDADSIQSNLKTFTAFNNRYYQSETGNQSAEWLLEKVRSYVPLNSSIDVSIFQHVYRQSSIIATIPGKTAKTVVVGAHQDSINGEAGGNRTTARAPGAGMTFLLRCSDQPLTPSDDNGSGSMTTLEAFRTLVQQEAMAFFKPDSSCCFAGLCSTRLFWCITSRGRSTRKQFLSTVLASQSITITILIEEISRMSRSRTWQIFDCLFAFAFA